MQTDAYAVPSTQGVPHSGLPHGNDGEMTTVVMEVEKMEVAGRRG